MKLKSMVLKPIEFGIFKGKMSIEISLSKGKSKFSLIAQQIFKAFEENKTHKVLVFVDVFEDGKDFYEEFLLLIESLKPLQLFYIGIDNVNNKCFWHKYMNHLVFLKDSKEKSNELNTSADELVLVVDEDILIDCGLKVKEAWIFIKRKSKCSYESLDNFLKFSNRNWNLHSEDCIKYKRSLDV